MGVRQTDGHKCMDTYDWGKGKLKGGRERILKLVEGCTIIIQPYSSFADVY